MGGCEHFKSLHAFSFGKTVPAYGFWIRHASGIRFDDVRIETVTADAPPPFVKGVDTSGVRINERPELGTQQKIPRRFRVGIH